MVADLKLKLILTQFHTKLKINFAIMNIERNISETAKEKMHGRKGNLRFQ